MGKGMGGKWIKCLPQNNKNTYLCAPKKQTDKRNEYEIYTQTNMGDHFPDPGQFVDGTLD